MIEFYERGRTTMNDVISHHTKPIRLDIFSTANNSSNISVMVFAKMFHDSFFCVCWAVKQTNFWTSPYHLYICIGMGMCFPLCVVESNIDRAPQKRRDVGRLEASIF